jgi:hypothetical protein
MQQRFYICLAVIVAGCIVLFACNSNKLVQQPQVTVSLTVSSARNQKVFIERIAYDMEKIVVMDSAVVVTAKDTIFFHVPLEPDRQYRIKVSDSHTACNFVADAPYIRIKINNINSNYTTIEGSPATSILKAFVKAQREMNDSLHKINMLLDSLAKNINNKSQVSKLLASRNTLSNTIQANNEAFADTVSNAAAFIQVFGAIEFDSRHKELKDLVNNAAKRFPNSPAVAQMKQDALDMLSIYEEEYNVGDSLPSISLPDVNGQPFTTASLRGRFYLLDFWASWYPKTLAINGIKKQVTEAYPPQKLQLVSVALDDNKADWANIIHSQNLNWVQLIDEDMWHGTAAKTLKFDSIPFNFLVNDKGRIIAKAIKPDSLMQVLRKTIK